MFRATLGHLSFEQQWVQRLKRSRQKGRYKQVFVHFRMKNTLHFLTTSTAAGLETATSTFRHVIYGVLATGITVSLLLAFSIFAYVAFYFAYVPAPIFRGLAHLVFEPCAETLGRCGYLNASVDLTVKPGGEYANGILMAGQPYLVAVELEMPESPPNWQVGMFMSCLQLRTRQGKTIKDNCRCVMEV